MNNTISSCKSISSRQVQSFNLVIMSFTERTRTASRSISSKSKSGDNCIKHDRSLSLHPPKNHHHWITTWQKQPPQTSSSKLNPRPSLARHPTRTADDAKSYSLASKSVILDSPMHIFSPNSRPFHAITASWITPSPLSTSYL